ncbi:MAG: LolA family protein [Candidatus Kryptoniota bacterium]
MNNNPSSMQMIIPPYWKRMAEKAFIRSFCYKLCLITGASFILSSAPAERGVSYLRNVLSKFSGIRDYAVDVRVHFELQEVQAPDMEGKFFYKSPDKVKIKSNGIFMVPKEIGIFNPRRFDPDKFVVELLDSLSCDGDSCVRVSLIPKNDRLRQNVILTIDEKKWLIKEISSRLPRGVEMTARITYGIFNSFSLPEKIDVDLKSEGQNIEQGESLPRGRFHPWVTGRVVIYYSNYKVNSGLSDSIFVNGQHY